MISAGFCSGRVTREPFVEDEGSAQSGFAHVGAIEGGAYFENRRAVVDAEAGIFVGDGKSGHDLREIQAFVEGKYHMGASGTDGLMALDICRQALGEK